MDLLQTSKIIRFPIYLCNYIRDTKNTLISLELGVYWLWVAFRFLLTLAPQTGYIHPDEYFQTVEVLAGDAFNTEISQPWEFNYTFPIRSIPVIYTTIYIPLSLLRKISLLTESFMNLNLINHYTLLVVPRLSMCLISFITDICLFKICYSFGQNYKERLVIYASSFVCIVFMTRTFTNTIEITCFNILLCMVALCMAESEKINYQSNFLGSKFKEAPTIPDQVRVKKLIRLLPRHSLKHCTPIALAAVAGFFNRPTFLLFAVTPLFYWFQRGLDVKSNYLKDFHIRIFVFSIYCMPLVCLFIYLDSAYFGYITWGELFNLKISFDNFVVTPLNFIKYNMNPSNLSQHGVHFRLLHLMVNIPLLFNVLGISGLLVVIKLFYRGTSSNWTLLPKSQSITGMMTLSFIVPVLGLSLFPHQEPRFIVPVLLPLIFLYSHLVSDFEEDWQTVVPFRKRYRKQKESKGFFKYPLKCIEYVQKATENFDNRYNLSGRYLARIRGLELVETKDGPRWATPSRIDNKEEMPKKTKMIKLWFFFNCICVLFFGFLHQGGIYGLTKNFHENLLVKPKYTTYNLVTSHVYSIPLHLLAQKKNYKYKNTNFVSYELGSENFDKIHLKLMTILKVSESKKKSVRRNYKVFYAFPATLLSEFRTRSWNFTYEIQNFFYPHFSSEALPQFTLDLAGSSPVRFSGVWGILNTFDCFPVRYVVEFFRQFGLVMVQVQLQK